MELIHIAELNPELPARDSKHFKAAVTLIWPYSSSQRQFALLLAEPEFRLRRNKGQVRARFSGSSAKALATTGVGIGDEVVLSLKGVQFVQEGTVSTPGRSIDWELEYKQTVVVHVLRDGREIANLELFDVAPTPAPRSPVRRETHVSPSPTQQWSSPAFLKRVRLSDGPFFEAPFDPLVDENADGHDKKRRRKSYRDWKAWTYNARTPSPEKDDTGMEDDSGDVDASPSRPGQLPRTPVSPPKPDVESVAVGPIDGAMYVEEEAGSKAPSKMDDFVRDDEYYDLYAGPDEIPPADAPYAFGGDTEANTEEEGEEDVLEDTDVASMSATEVDTELEEDRVQEHEPASTQSRSNAHGRPEHEADLGSSTEEDSLIATSEARNATDVSVGDVTVESAGFLELEYSERVEGAPIIVMPPPTLPTLNTSFTTTTFPTMLTPIGREPASPTLQPLDSALLPLPSPFPGERDGNITSYLDQYPLETNAVNEEEPPSEASYILENSFFSSINSSKSHAFHPDHESAFTPVRFTFGMDGAGFSRPLELSSPVPAETRDVHKIAEHDLGIASLNGLDAVSEMASAPLELLVNDGSNKSREASVSSLPHDDEATTTETHLSRHIDVLGEQINAADLPEEDQDEVEVIELSSDSESEGSKDSEVEDDILAAEALVVDDIGDGTPSVSETKEETSQHTLDSQNPISHHYVDSTSNSQTAAVAEVVNPSSPLGSSDVEELAPGSRDYNLRQDETSEDLFLIHQDQGRSFMDTVPAKTANMQSHSELTAMEYTSVFSDLIASTSEGAATHTPKQKESWTALETRNDSQPLTTHDYDTPTAMDNSDKLMEDHSLQEEHVSGEQQKNQDVEEQHPDIKVESIEEGSVFQLGELETHREQNVFEEAATRPPGEILIDVPDEGHKLGELHTISVPATAPARNTRSKTKASISPTKEDILSPKRTTRSTRSKASVTPIARKSLSPTRTRAQSTMSPSQDATQTSPHSLRSQSNLLSPVLSTSTITAATRRSPRKHASQRSVGSISGIGSPQTRHQDPFLTSFEPSQELGASQGRYSDVPFVKDSEEERLHSEHSKPTVKYSDDWNMFTNFSDPAVENEQDNESASLKPPPATAPETRASARVKAKRRKSDVQMNDHTESSPIQPHLSSPSRKLRSASSFEVGPPSPRVLRTASQHVQNVKPSPNQQAEDIPNEATPKAKDVTYPALLGEDENANIRTSPSPNIQEVKGSSPPPAVSTTFASVNQQSILGSNMLITPEATQQTDIESQTSLIVGQQQQNLPMTPQLTQAPSAGTQSLTKSMTTDLTAMETPSKISPSLVTKSTPRRNATETDVASPSTTPKEQSPDMPSDLAIAAENSETPSIGLSTPLAYYTPLNALTYFLNRSSQFHTSSNPDILALVTSATTPAQRSTKGRKDWTTTLHVTDISTWPASTVVNIFRPYQTALPVADVGDVVLLRAFAVKSLNRHPTLISADESSWCVWRYGKPVWGKKKGLYGDVKAREEVKGPVVERGEGEWSEVEKIRNWYMQKIKVELEAAEKEKVHTRSMDHKEDVSVVGESGENQRQTRSRDKAGDGRVEK